MTEHEKLKEICDKIDYKYYYREDYGLFLSNERDNPEGHKVISVRDLIFTQEFISAFIKELHKHHNDGIYWFHKEFIEENLNNSVEYLYSLIK